MPGRTVFIKKTLTSDLLLLLTAAIWGFAFVAQRAGMSYIGPFLFNGVRFALGAAVLAPIIMLRRRRRTVARGPLPLGKGAAAGLVLFAGASLQQCGLVYTTAGNAGFVTGLYVVLVPILGLFAGQSTGWRTWVGAVLAVAGMYLLSNAGSSRMTTGDMVVLAGAIFWAVHIQMISRFMKECDALPLAALQFVFCSVLSLLTALVMERIDLQAVADAAVPILYGGLVSVGIAYTLQVVAQKRAHPSHAAIIMSMEAVFALAGGWLILGEDIVLQGIVGGGLMMTAMILSATGRARSGVITGL